MSEQPQQDAQQKQEEGEQVEGSVPVERKQQDKQDKQVKQGQEEEEEQKSVEAPVTLFGALEEMRREALVQLDTTFEREAVAFKLLQKYEDVLHEPSDEEQAGIDFCAQYCIEDEDEILLRGYVVIAHNVAGKEQERVLLVTKNALYRVEFDFAKCIVKHYVRYEWDDIHHVAYGPFKFVEPKKFTFASFTLKDHINSLYGFRVATNVRSRNRNLPILYEIDEDKKYRTYRPLKHKGMKKQQLEAIAQEMAFLIAIMVPGADLEPPARKTDALSRHNEDIYEKQRKELADQYRKLNLKLQQHKFLEVTPVRGLFASVYNKGGFGLQSSHKVLTAPAEVVTQIKRRQREAEERHEKRTANQADARANARQAEETRMAAVIAEKKAKREAAERARLEEEERLRKEQEEKDRLRKQWSDKYLMPVNSTSSDAMLSGTATFRGLEWRFAFTKGQFEFEVVCSSSGWRWLGETTEKGFQLRSADADAGRGTMEGGMNELFFIGDNPGSNNAPRTFAREACVASNDKLGIQDLQVQGHVPTVIIQFAAMAAKHVPFVKQWRVTVIQELERQREEKARKARERAEAIRRQRAAAAAQRRSKPSEMWKRRLFGKIKVVNAFPDCKVQVVNAFADLHVQEVKAFPNAPGKWQMVTYGEDYKVQFVNAFGDIKIKYVSAFPGPQG